MNLVAMPNSNTIQNNQKKSSMNFEMMKKPTILSLPQSPATFASTFHNLKKETLTKIHNKANIQDYLKDYTIKDGKKTGDEVVMKMEKPKLDTGIVFDSVDLIQ